MRKQSLIGFTGVFATLGAAVLVTMWALPAMAALSQVTEASPTVRPVTQNEVWTADLRVTATDDIGDQIPGVATLVFGIHPDATDGYDPVIDDFADLAPPSTPYIQPHFSYPNNDPGPPDSRLLKRSFIPSGSDPAEWPLRVTFTSGQFSFQEANLTLTWDAAFPNVPGHLGVELLNAAKTQVLADMRAVNQFDGIVTAPFFAGQTDYFIRVSTPPPPPPGPVLVTPPDRSRIGGSALLFSWQPSNADIDSYRLQITQSGDDFSDPQVNSGGIPTNAFAHSTGRLVDGSYLWRVRGEKAANPATEFSDPFLFTLDNTPPSPSSLISPSSGDHIFTSAVSFEWALSTSGDIAQYRLQVTSGDSFNTDIDEFFAGAIRTLPGNGIYKWRVGAIDDLGNATVPGKLEVRSFTINDITPPGAPALLSPGNAASVNTSTPLFNWAPSTGDPFTYRLQVVKSGDDLAAGPFAVDEVIPADRTQLQLSTAAALADGIYRWRVIARDRALNTGSSVARTFAVDTAPKIDNVFTGDHWDPDDERIEGDRRTGVGTYLPGVADRTSIRIQFNEDLDGSTIVAADFEVTEEGGNPLVIADALWFSADDSNTGLSVRNNVFLVLADPLAGDATPGVTLVGSVSDAGGSAVTGLTVESDDVIDGIAPTATITLDTSISSRNVAVTVETDENIRTLEPVLELFISTSDDPDIAVAQPTGIQPPRSSRTAGQNIWTFDLSIAQSNRYSVVVTVDDASRNQSTTGKQDWTDAGSISFEIDNTLPFPRWDQSDPTTLTTWPVDGEEETQFFDPFFIEISWRSEAWEYVGDSHRGVTLTKAVLDGADVLPLASVFPFDDRLWTIRIPNIALGDHTLAFNGRDDAGNTLADDEELTFRVVAPPSWDLLLTPGINLVSIPADPVDKRINAVFGDALAVDLVFTRAGKRWLVAQRDPDTGRFERTGSSNDLRWINSRHAYFVRAVTSVAVEIELAPLGFQEVPPAIRVKKNRWALVPVMSLRPIEKIPQWSALDADEYFGDNWRVAWTFDRGRWIRVVPAPDTRHQCYNYDQTPPPVGDCGAQDPANAGEYFTVDVGGQREDVVEIGRGYWVSFKKNDRIVPQ